MQRPARRIERLLNSAPLLVVTIVLGLFAAFVHLEELIVLAGVLVYVVLRACSADENSYSPIIEAWIARGIWSVLTLLAWMASIRSESVWGGLGIILLLLGIGYSLRESSPKTSGKDSLLQWSTLFLTWMLCVFLAAIALVPTPDFLANEQTLSVTWMAAIVLPAWIGLSLRVPDSLPRINPGRTSLPWVVVAMIAFLSAGTHHVQTAVVWYQAGVEERAYTPFQFDTAEDIQYAERAPYRAFQLYADTWQRLERSGLRSATWGMQNRMAARMAHQASRTGDVRLLNLAYQFLQRTSGNHSVSKAVWINDSFYQNLRRRAPDLSEQNHFWVDIEFLANGNRTLLLDRWGRVFDTSAGNFSLVWESASDRDDAVDLEIHDETLIVLFANQQIHSSEPLPFSIHDITAYSMGGSAVDLELFSGVKGAVVVSSRGELAGLGEIPAGFASWADLYFVDSVVVDFELDVGEIGYYLLNENGAIHGNPAGSVSMAYQAPEISAELVPYWAGQRMAIDLAMDANQRGLSLATREGEVYTLSRVPFRETWRPVERFAHRGVGITSRPDGALLLLEANGEIQTLTP